MAVIQGDKTMKRIALLLVLPLLCWAAGTAVAAESVARPGCRVCGMYIDQ